MNKALLTIPEHSDIFKTTFENSVNFCISLDKITQYNKKSPQKNKDSLNHFSKVILHLILNDIFLKDELSIHSVNVSNLNQQTAIETFELNVFFQDHHQKDNIKNLFSQLIRYSLETHDCLPDSPYYGKLNGKYLFEATFSNGTFNKNLIEQKVIPLMQYFLLSTNIPENNNIPKHSKVKI